ncbi:hypothetical protein [Roseovarius pacificus]|uniref:hypothetical protein n=1 Tax=Roseovarius pacificus TaxID=337701 RepID=UPI00403996ED
MSGKSSAFSIEQRNELRERLRAHQERYGISPQTISDQIAAKTGLVTTKEAGGKRVTRFLKAQGKQEDKFIAAVADYLDDVAPIDVEESAVAFARLLTQSQDRRTDLSPLIGRYQAYLRPMRPAPHPPLPPGFAGVPPEHIEPRRGEFETAYAIIEMTPLEESNALLVADTVSNIAIDPEIDTFPERSAALSSTGALIPFGFSGFLVATRSLMETRLYRLIKIEDEPLTLRGHLTLNGLQASVKRRMDLQVFDPDYEVELVRVADVGEV